MVKSTITLASGKEMPLVGFGLWKVPKETAADTVYNVSIVYLSIHFWKKKLLSKTQ
jgi:diketogulonate reductase-like aldo/keto reductase